MTGAELRARRVTLGLTQAELAARLGRQQRTISEWETGYCPIGYPETLDLALRALETEQRDDPDFYVHLKARLRTA